MAAEEPNPEDLEIADELIAERRAEAPDITGGTDFAVVFSVVELLWRHEAWSADDLSCLSQTLPTAQLILELLSVRPGEAEVTNDGAICAIFDQDILRRRGAFVIDIERASAVGQGTVIDHGHALGRDLFANFARVDGAALAVEISL